MSYLYDPFSIVLALLPLIAYLLVLGAVRFSGRALVTTGGREIAALALAICGFVAVGPAELMFPTNAATFYGPMVWFALIGFYALVVSLLALTTQPKLVVYGRGGEDVFAALMIAAARIDDSLESDQQRKQVHLPKLGVRLRVEAERNADYCRIHSFEPIESSEFWRQLLAQMRGELQTRPTTGARQGFGAIGVATSLLVIVAGLVMFKHTEIVEGFRNWLWR